MKRFVVNAFETERLLLRKFKLSDAKMMFENYAKNEEVAQYLSWKAHKYVEETKTFLREKVLPSYKPSDEKKYACHYALVLKKTNQVIGSIAIRIDQDKNRASFAWVISKDYWGQGLVPEAAKVMVKMLLDFGFERVQAVHFAGNDKSGRVMQKIGMKHEGTLKKFSKNNEGKLVDCEMYAITQ